MFIFQCSFVLFHEQINTKYHKTLSHFKLILNEDLLKGYLDLESKRISLAVNPRL